MNSNHESIVGKSVDRNDATFQSLHSKLSSFYQQNYHLDSHHEVQSRLHARACLQQDAESFDVHSLTQTTHLFRPDLHAMEYNTKNDNQPLTRRNQHARNFYNRSPSFRVGSPTSVLQDSRLVESGGCYHFGSPVRLPTASASLQQNSVQQLRQQLHQHIHQSKHKQLHHGSSVHSSLQQQLCNNSGTNQTQKGGESMNQVLDPSLSMLARDTHSSSINTRSQHERVGPAHPSLPYPQLLNPTNNFQPPTFTSTTTVCGALSVDGKNEVFGMQDGMDKECNQALEQQQCQQQWRQQEQLQKQKQQLPDLWTQFLNPGGNFKYKTEICTYWSETRTCQFGDKCDFAHGEDELRLIDRHPKYKTEVCRTYAQQGYCQYGTRCR
eukprot:TRINITY_DN4135_c0_g1_i1.p2 TRINITY_DN4135_c0_g1~~TRINITY_DN4135_c0_g1_i1.p2  ORF type:complete len:381 (+),score=11.00 TRINITY_DN4135_c0_g1_i1:277-1419(+)